MFSTDSVNYNLIIQGPILSTGRTGMTYNRNLSHDAIVYYQCEENILRIVKKFYDLFSEIVIVTWDNEVLDEKLFKNYDRCKILRLENLTPAVIIDNQQLPTDFNNKYKQFYSLYNAALFLKESKSQFIVKIRTDQYVDLQLLIKEHRESIIKDSINKDKIFVPFISKKNFLVSDFYFVAKKQTFIDFTRSMLWGNYLEFNSSVHIDMSLKYAYLYHKNQINLPLRTYFLNSFDKNPNKDKVKLKNYLSDKVYRTFSEELIESVIWRGDKLIIIQDNSKIFDANFNEIFTDPRKHRNSGIKDFLYINVPAYLVAIIPSLRSTFLFNIIQKLFFTVKKNCK